jgi:hypothetical protein
VHLAPGQPHHTCDSKSAEHVFFSGGCSRLGFWGFHCQDVNNGGDCLMHENIMHIAFIHSQK